MRQRHVRSTQSSLFKTKPFSFMSEWRCSAVVGAPSFVRSMRSTSASPSNSTRSGLWPGTYLIVRFSYVSAPPGCLTHVLMFGCLFSFHPAQL